MPYPLMESLLEEKRKNIKLADSSIGKSGFTNPKTQNLENEIEDILKRKTGLKRSMDYVFVNGGLRFEKAERVDKKVLDALKPFLK